MKTGIFADKRLLLALLSLTLWFCFQTPVTAQKPDNLSKAVKRSEQAGDILTRVLDASGSHIPEELIKNAQAIAVFPEVSKVNLLIEHLMIGYGVVSHRTSGGWSLPAYYAFKGGKLGPNSVGTESPSIVMLFMNEKAVEWIKKGEIHLEGEKKAIGGQVVSGSQAIEPVKANILVYTFTKGQLAGKTYAEMFMVKGYRIYPDNNMNKRVYQKKAAEILNLEQLNSITLPQGISSFQEKLKLLAR